MDQFYNERAATWARDLVMKMDDGEAQEFVTHVTRSVLLEDISNNRRTLDSRVMQVQKSLLADAERVVSKGVLSPVDVVMEISKALGTDPYARDTQGRFSSQESRVRTNRATRPLPKTVERQRGIESAKKVAAASGMRSTKLSPRERSAYQQQYEQLADAMDNAVNSGFSGVKAILEDKTTGRRSTISLTSMSQLLEQGNGVNWNPARQNLVAVTGSTAPPTQPTFDLVSGLGTKGKQTSQFAQRWTNASEDTPGTNDRTYRRVEAGSKLLADTVGPGMPKTYAAAKFGEFVGQYGPEAEKVIGPHARKTAYRYRGTEKKPDSALVRSRNSVVEGISNGQDPAKMPAEMKQRASVQAATQYLSNRLPSLSLSEIQRKSGKIPPSEGVIIDRDGRIATQAVGFADDHYLPFNLKNLKNLRGGEYVRTRTTGGLTTEDIYTGLVSGARQVTVVSNSGVFTVNFEDDFRGVRRYNDKAASMVDRYAKTLDAIKEGKIERQPISPRVRAEIREQVNQEMPRTAGYQPDEIENEIKARIDNYREIPQLTTREIEAIEMEAASKGTNDYERRQVVSDLTEQALEEKRSRFYQLDGEGYAAALESMKEQYPYYISNVSFAHRRGALSESGDRADRENLPGVLTRFTSGSDKGYVKARHNRPDQVLEGFYDSGIAGEGEISGTGKTRASHTNYQNWEHNPVRGSLRAADEREKTGEGAAKPKSAVEQARQERAKIQVERSHKEALNGVLSAYSGVDLKGQHPIITEAKDNFERVYSDTAKRKDLESALLQVHDALTAAGEPLASATEARVRTLKTESGRSGGVTWTQENLGTKASSPYAFSEDAYQPGAKGNIVAREMRERLKGLSNVGLQGAEKMSDADLSSAAASMGILAGILRSGTLGDRGKRELAELSVDLRLDESWVGAQINRIERSGDPAKEAAKWAQGAEDAERVRRLLLNGVPDEYGTGDAKVAPAPKQLPKTLSAADAADMLKNVAATVSDTVMQDDYNRMVIHMRAGQIQQARKIAQDINEEDPVKMAVLKQVFPDLDEPY